MAQLIGLGLSIALLNAIEATGDTTNAVWAWVAIQSVHVVLRFKSLSVIQLPTLNQKRSCLLVNAFLKGQQLPGNAVLPVTDIGNLVSLPASLITRQECSKVRMQSCYNLPWSPSNTASESFALGFHQVLDVAMYG